MTLPFSDEIWKPIPSYPGVSASSYGRIRVEPYYAPLPNGGQRMYGGSPTYGQWDGSRYIYARRGYTTKRVHRLVCEAFNGDPLPDQVCMHLDENSRNNRPENLKWGTQKENLNFPGFIAYCESRTGDNHPHAIRKKKNG